MNFKSSVSIMLALCCAAASATQIRATKPSAVYNVGEQVEFKVIDPVENMTYTLRDGNTVIAKNKALAPGETVTYTATNPGFILITLDAGEVDKDGKVIVRNGGAAVEPEKIQPSTEYPADFNEFWDKELAKMRSNPLEIIHETPIPDEVMDRPGFVGYEVEVRRGDITVTGFLVLPKDAAPKSLPGILTFNGASQVNAHFPMARTEASRGNAISFNTNFHAFPNRTTRDRKAEGGFRKQVARYQYKNAEDPENYAMRKIFLRTALAADYLEQRPEYDGKRLAAMGSSLGGCQALVCAALVPEVKYCVSNATAMCNHFGAQSGQIPGWPKLLENVPAAEKTCPYFDMVNFARRVKCRTEMSVGFIDVTCPPAATYAAYNALATTDKVMNHTVSGAHGPAWDKDEKPVFNHGAKHIVEFFKNYKE